MVKDVKEKESVTTVNMLLMENAIEHIIIKKIDCKTAKK